MSKQRIFSRLYIFNQILPGSEYTYAEAVFQTGHSNNPGSHFFVVKDPESDQSLQLRN